MLPVNRVLKKYRYITVNIDIFVIDKQIVSLFLNLIQDILKSNIIFVNRYTDILWIRIFRMEAENKHE